MNSANPDREYIIKKRVYNSLKHKAKKEGRDSNMIPLSEFIEMITSPCYYCGSDPVRDAKDYSQGRIYSETVVKINGIDRYDSNRGYETDNCVPCCFVCNCKKCDRTARDFKLKSGMDFELLN